MQILFLTIPLFQHDLVLCLCQFSFFECDQVDLFTILVYTKCTVVFHAKVQIKLFLQPDTLFFQLFRFCICQRDKYTELSVFHLIFFCLLFGTDDDRIRCTHDTDDQIHNKYDQCRKCQITKQIFFQIPQDPFP